MKVAMRVGLLIQPDEGAVAEHLIGEAIIFGLGSIAPYNFCRLGEASRFFYPTL
jgi:hypothetical protein